jgi:translation initiation factor eIF-2B subunit alpha
MAPLLAASSGSPTFDIVSTYRSLLKADPDLTMPVAAIDSLVQALAAHPTSTISETLEYLKSLTNTLIASTPNPISLSAGTDLFQRYLASSLHSRAASDPAVDFKNMRAHLLTNGRLFVQRAKDSRDTIAGYGRMFVRDGSTILTAGGSRVVGALLEKAAQQNARFKVVYVLSSAVGGQPDSVPEGTDVVASLRAKGVPVATIGEGAVGYALGKVDMVIVGAEGVVENGGVISRLGTYQIGSLAHSAGKPLYVVAESHKFVRLYPLNQYDLPIKQTVLDFKADDTKAAATPTAERSEHPLDRPREQVDFTVSNLPS